MIEIFERLNSWYLIANMNASQFRLAICCSRSQGTTVHTEGCRNCSKDFSVFREAHQEEREDAKTARAGSPGKMLE